MSEIKSERQNETAALKPCPLCGGSAEMWHASKQFKRPAWIACMSGCLVLTKEFASNEDAIRHWNTRAQIS